MKLKKVPEHSAVIKIIKSDKSEGGIYVIDYNNIKEKAEVIQIGSGVTKFKVGDTILFKSWAVNNYKIDGHEFAIMKEEFYDGILQ